VAENAATDDEVVWRMQFEEEKLSRVQRTKLRRSAGLPEIDLVVWRGLAQLVKPGFIRNSDEEADHGSTPLVFGFIMNQISKRQLAIFL
jgi:hypothetical protein